MTSEKKQRRIEGKKVMEKEITGFRIL